MRLSELQSKFQAAKKPADWYCTNCGQMVRNGHIEWQWIVVGLHNVLYVVQAKHRQHLLTVQFLSSWMNRYRH